MLEINRIKLFQKFLECIQGNEDLTNEECNLIRIHGEEFDQWIEYITDKEKPQWNGNNWGFILVGGQEFLVIYLTLLMPSPVP